MLKGGEKVAGERGGVKETTICTACTPEIDEEEHSNEKELELLGPLLAAQQKPRFR